VSPYRLAIDETTTTIELRAKDFRNLVVGVMIVGLGSFGAALLFKRWSALSTLLLLIPLCGLFFCFDAWRLSTWRSRLLESWSHGRIDFWALLEAFHALSTLPRETLAAMLTSLPAAAPREAEQALAPKSRVVVAAVVNAIYAYRADLAALRTFASAIVVTAVIMTVCLHTGFTLLLAGLVLGYPALSSVAIRSRLHAAYEQTRAARLDSTFDHRAFERSVIDLDWRPISAEVKARFMTRIRVGDAGLSGA